VGMVEPLRAAYEHRSNTIWSRVSFIAPALNLPPTVRRNDSGGTADQRR
jgi:hypothetical protein